MSKSRWAVGLQGEPFDLEDARELFGSNMSIQVIEIQVPNRKLTALIADEFEDYEAAINVSDAGQRVLALINGYLFARDADRKPLRVATVHSKDADGQWGSGTVFASADIQMRGLRGRGYVASVRADGTSTKPEPPIAPEIAWLSATMDDTATDVLHTLRGEPDWFDLFAAFERMRDDLNKRLPKKSKPSDVGWPDTNHFTKSAQVYRHSRIKWPPGYTPATSMPLREARVFVARLVRSWLQWRSSQTTS